MWRDAVLIAGKDLRIEVRSRVGVNQVAPFGVLVLILFALAFDADRALLNRITSGLFWVAVLLSALLAIQRSFAIEAADGDRDGLRLAGLDPAGIFVGKATALAAQLLVLEAVLAAGVVVLYGTAIDAVGLLAATALAATVALAASGTVYGVLAAGVRVRETLLPLLLLPVVAPVLLAATRASEAALNGAASEGWPWVRLLVIFAGIYAAAGVIAFGPLLEDS